ncbi:hypothetical protein NMG60_11014331 [Bertholletia excelsa]
MDTDENEVRRVFEMFDRDRDGKVTIQELREFLHNLGILAPVAEMVDMMKKIDENGDCAVDVDEFGWLYRWVLEEKLAFNVFDRNSNGFIEVEELRTVLQSLGLKGRTLEDCKLMIKKVNLDGNGKIDFQEFKKMMKRGGFEALSSG